MISDLLVIGKAFLVLPNFLSCLYNSIETIRKVHVFYFLNSYRYNEIRIHIAVRP